MAESLLLLCLLLISGTSCSPPPPTHAPIATDGQPQATDGQPLSDDAVLGRVFAQLEALIQDSVRKATTELTSQLVAVSSRLDRLSEEIPRPAEAVPGGAEGDAGAYKVIPRSEAVEQAMAAMLDRQERVEDAVVRLRADSQNEFAVFSKRQNEFHNVLSKVSEGITGAVSLSFKTLEGIQETLASVSKKQTDIEQSLCGKQDDGQEPHSSFIDVKDGTSLLNATRHSASEKKFRSITGPTMSFSVSVLQDQILGGLCRGDEDCSNIRSDSVCSNLGWCECREGFQRVAGGFCRPHPRLSESCRSNSDCATEHALCTDGTCVCSSDRLNFNNTECLMYPHLGEECVTDSDCQLRTDEAVCTNNVCICPASLLNFNNAECRPYPGLLEPCRTDSECQFHSEPAVCSDNVCTCPSSFWNFNNTECRPGAQEGESCLYEEDCTTTLAGLSCVNETCNPRVCEVPDDNHRRFRLHGGSSCDNGFVQAFWIDSDSWLQVCDPNWDEREASAVCRYMGFERGTPGEPGTGAFKAQIEHWPVCGMDCNERAGTPLACYWRWIQDTCEGCDPVYVTCHSD